MNQYLQTIAARAASGLRALAKLPKSPDLLMAFGASGITYGAWQVYPPAGFIVGGVLVLVAGVLAARKGA